MGRASSHGSLQLAVMAEELQEAGVDYWYHGYWI